MALTEPEDRAVDCVVEEIQGTPARQNKNNESYAKKFVVDKRGIKTNKSRPTYRVDLMAKKRIFKENINVNNTQVSDVAVKDTCTKKDLIMENEGTAHQHTSDSYQYMHLLYRDPIPNYATETINEPNTLRYQDSARQNSLEFITKPPNLYFMRLVP